MKSERIRAWALVVAQFAGIIWIFATGPLLAQRPYWLLLECVGWALGLWALVVMGPGVFSPLPVPRQGSSLIESGPYRAIRHPMYTAVLVVTGALAADAPAPARLAVWMALLAVLLLKIRFEERLLAARVAGYAAYRGRTRRLLPWLF